MGLRDFYKKTDAALQEAEAAATCKSCKEPYCCRMRVYAPIAAGELIAETLKDTPLLRDRLRDHIDDWDTGKLPCVFLEQGRCSIYPVRPLVCRAHFVTSPPKLCGEGLGGVTIRPDQHHRNQRFALQQLNSPFEEHPLPEVVLKALEK